MAWCSVKYRDSFTFTTTTTTTTTSGCVVKELFGRYLIKLFFSHDNYGSSVDKAVWPILN